MKYVAFFRGINVGGKNIVKMAELKKLFSELGFQGVQTYIQSGNVVFETEDDAVRARRKIEEGFSSAFGFACAVTLRTAGELAAMADALPFDRREIEEAEAANPAVEHLYVYLLDGTDVREQFDELVRAYAGQDRMELRANEIDLLCRESIRTSKLAAALGRLKTPVTARNWKTICKLREMMGEGLPG